MLEAVNSVLSNASYTRAAAEQTSVATSYAANPERVQQVSTQAPYISLYIKVDVNFNKAVLQIRDIDTGDVVRQIPTESQLEAYRRAQSSNAVKPREAIDVADSFTPQSETKQSAATGAGQASVSTPSAPTSSSPVNVSATTAQATAPAAPAPAPVPVSVDTEA